MTAMRIEPEDITLPPELALAQEPDVTPALCDRCEDKPAEYADDKGNDLCASCVDNADEILDLKKYEPWTITGTETAEWALRKLAEARNKIAEIEAQATAFNERIDRWAADQIRPLVRDEAFFGHHLTEWARAQREADPKVKSIHLPSGTIASRAGRPKLVVVDEDALVGFLKAFCDEMDIPPENLMRVKVEPKLTEVRKFLTPEGMEEGVAVVAHGDQVPGLELQGGGVSYSVKVAS